ncbi:hypothetical protein [Nocardia amikacinitolerans]|uniref:hypothetical protein n=1 Tax=Nocardia amikacinitolerans TaxID=756689 RepID=UPI0020A37022|nr:hypothetical protein [Nocardia amikacinitolerans]MCP2277523.1 hypothetical protein [Nocardia amikacinitolerans]MCP2290291.1 hypothetical protein [Nocardia amikacinitolerans]
MRFDAAKGDIVSDAYRRTKGPVAYLDESYQTCNRDVKPAETFYIFTAVVVRQPDMAEIRAGLREIVGGRYWHSTEALQDPDGPAAMKDMLEFLTDGSEPCLIAHRVPLAADDRDGEDARRACYRGIAIELATGGEGYWDPVELLVLEERNQQNFRNKDRANHKELVSAELIPRNVRLLQTSPKFEHLLWLPDVVSSAYRRSLTHRDSTSRLFGIIENRVHFVKPIE